VAMPDLQSYRVRKGIAFKVEPDSAIVSVDGKPMGPARRYGGGMFGRGDWLELSPGRHRVTVTAPGYERRDLAVEVNDGADRERQKIDVSLARGEGG